MGACYLIGGASINVWQDPWVPWVDGFISNPKAQDDPKNPLMASYLINQETHPWKASLIQEIFDADSSKAILSIPVSLRPKLEKLVWVHNLKGNFTVKLAFHTITEPYHSLTSSDIVWKKTMEN